MYEAKQWKENSTYMAPMVIINDLHVFVGDVVTISTGGSQDICGKVLHFYQLVRCFITNLN